MAAQPKTGQGGDSGGKKKKNNTRFGLGIFRLLAGYRPWGVFSLIYGQGRGGRNSTSSDIKKKRSIQRTKGKKNGK